MSRLASGALLDQPPDGVSINPAAPFALDYQHIELADQIAEDSGAVTGHASQWIGSPAR